MNILKILTPQRRTGNLGEKAAARHLKRNGYKILKKNYTAADGEIDIIAEDKLYTVFVEVKTRSVSKDNKNEPRPASAVNADKQKKLIKSAKYFLAKNESGKRVRFDIIEVLVDPMLKKPVSINQIENAFNINTAYRRN